MRHTPISPRLWLLIVPALGGAFLALLLLPPLPSVHAKLGETLAQLVSRFGADYRQEDALVHFRNPGRVSVDVILGTGNVSVEETYFSYKPLDGKGEPPAEVVQAILKTNAPAGTTWREADYPAADYALRSADGSLLAALRYRRPQRENAIWTMTVCRAKESFALAERMAAEDRQARRTPAPTAPTSTGWDRATVDKWTEHDLANNARLAGLQADNRRPTVAATPAPRNLPSIAPPPVSTPAPKPSPATVRVGGREYTEAELLAALNQSQSLAPPTTLIALPSPAVQDRPQSPAEDASSSRATIKPTLATSSFTEATRLLADPNPNQTRSTLPGVIDVPAGSRLTFVGSSKDEQLWLMRLAGTSKDVWVPATAFGKQEIPESKPTPSTIAAEVSTIPDTSSDVPYPSIAPLLPSRQDQTAAVSPNSSAAAANAATSHRQTLTLAPPLPKLKLYQDVQNTCRMLLPEDGWVLAVPPPRGSNLALEGPKGTLINVRRLEGVIGERSLGVLFARTVKERFPLSEMRICPPIRTEHTEKTKREVLSFSASSTDPVQRLARGLPDGPLKQGILAGGAAAGTNHESLDWHVITGNAVTWIIEMEMKFPVPEPEIIIKTVPSALFSLGQDVSEALRKNPEYAYGSFKGYYVGWLSARLTDVLFEADGLPPVIIPNSTIDEIIMSPHWNVFMDVFAW